MEQARNRYHIYRRITDQIAAAIAAGAPTFEMPWHRPGLAIPVNVMTTKPYRGINVLSLWVTSQVRGYGGGYWATYWQWAKLGAQVRKGEAGSAIVFYKEMERTSALDDSVAGEPEKYLIARASFVFNADQVDGWRPPPRVGSPRPPALIVDHAEQFVQGVGADIRETDGDACYLPRPDYIRMPRRDLFVGSSTSTATEAYYATLFHELIHWTAHESRLARDLSQRFGDETYAMEELVAELGAAFLCAENEITNSPRVDHAAYVASWLAVLGGDAKAIVTAAGRASTAVQFLSDRSAHELNRSE